jgi:hypothetical protein
MEATRKVTRQQRRARAGAPRRRPPYLWIGLAAVAVVVFGAALLRPGRSAVAPEGVQVFANLSRDHMTGTVTYPQTPPAGGAHAPAWQNCGFYDEAIPNETAVHSLEHGAVWITYRPDLGADELALLRGVARQSFVLVSPFPNLPAPVVASAWGHQLRLPSASDPRLAQFVRYFRLGPQTPEPGASCTGGVGIPD